VQDACPYPGRKVSVVFSNGPDNASVVPLGGSPSLPRQPEFHLYDQYKERRNSTSFQRVL